MDPLYLDIRQGCPAWKFCEPYSRHEFWHEIKHLLVIQKIYVDSSGMYFVQYHYFWPQGSSAEKTQTSKNPISLVIQSWRVQKWRGKSSKCLFHNHLKFPSTTLSKGNILFVTEKGMSLSSVADWNKWGIVGCKAFLTAKRMRQVSERK